MRNSLNFNNKLLINIFFIVFGWFSLSVFAQGNQDLWLYVQNDRAGEVKSLLNKGLDPNTRTSSGNPLLMQAVRDAAWEVFDVVLENPRTDINIQNAYQETPLMYVSIVGDLPRARKLVAKGAQVNQLGWTALHYAAVRGHTDVVKFLLEQGAMPNAPAPDGTSPIMMAARSGNTETVQALINAGADPAAVNDKAENAVDAARKAGHNKLADALEILIRNRRPQ